MTKSISLATLLMLTCVSLQGLNYNKEEVLSVVAQYNPAILEKASADEGYKAILQELASAYNAEKTDESFVELVALVRNFDNSLDLATSANRYQDALLLNALNGMDLTYAKDTFHQEVQTILTRIWAVTLQVQDLALDIYKERLKQVKKDPNLAELERAVAEAELKIKIKETKREIKNLKKYKSEQLSAAADVYVLQTENDFNQKMQAARQAQEAENLEVKSNHKKPVAK